MSNSVSLNSGFNQLQVEQLYDTFEKISDGAWNGTPLRMGAYYLWVDSSGRLRIKSTAPTGDTDGTIIGTQA